MIEEVAEAVAAGLVVGLPTDTVYGVGVDPQNEEAVRRLYELKGRPAHKPVGLLVADLAQAREIAVLSGPAAELAERHWPGALTLVVTPRVVLPNWVGDRNLRTVGIRVPDHPLALALLRRTGPMAVTSANRSGEPEALSDVEAREIFGDGVAVYLPGECPGGAPSTVVDATGRELVVLREGPVRT